MIKIFDLTFYLNEETKTVDVALNRHKKVTDEMIIEGLSEFLNRFKNESKENKDESIIN